MIIRSGLIMNRPDISRDAFDRHWLEVHGPLARVVPHLRAYTQNHMVTQLVAPESTLHRVDGISQLWFDGVSAMNEAMRSVEQQLCVEDIKGFLSAVTLVIQQPGQWREFGAPARRARHKVMAVLAGPGALGSNVDHLCESFGRRAPNGGRMRVNPVIDRGHSVDRDVPRANDDLVSGIVELWFNEAGDIPKFVQNGLNNNMPVGIECVAALQVEEFPILSAPASAAL
jgi:uncharacterized protein (TIGR02118 family)